MRNRYVLGPYSGDMSNDYARIGRRMSEILNALASPVVGIKKKIELKAEYEALKKKKAEIEARMKKIRKGFS